ncbi:MAG: phosphoribosylformylglycinamidine synthase subunit PurS [Acidimicrobiia bacterium]|nr:phosphoribosylformylglycinamidine synthase subunit PurS [Acidimicrobiia bacterium]
MTINRRPEIADPEGTTVRRALEELGFEQVTSVRMDRVIHMEVAGEDRDEIQAQVTKMCEQLLANPVLEDFEIEVGG